MVSTFTSNKAHLEKPAAGDYVDTWAPPVNANWDVCDVTTGGNLSVTIDVANVTLTTDQAKNLIFNLSGTLTANRSLIFPAVGGIYIIYNNCTTTLYTVTAITSAGGSTGVAIPVGGRSIIVSDGTNCYMADDNTLARFNSYAGSPNGNVAGTQATLLNPASVVWDRTNHILYVCNTTGNAATAAWTAVNASVPFPRGYLTPTSGTAIITSDTTISSGGTLYYTPYVGNILPIPDGTAFSTYSFSELSLVTSASQAASAYTSGAITTASIYDVYAFVDSGTVRIGFSPSWVAGSGSGTPGSCARGAGAGSAAISRLNGLFTNTNAMALLNGATTYNISARCGTYLGSVLIDSVAGQITCHRSYGQSRKWGIWNYYNRVPVYLKSGDATANWSTNNATFRVSRNDTSNNCAMFTGVAEDVYSARFEQQVAPGSASTGSLGVGINSATVSSGTNPVVPPSVTNMPGSASFTSISPLGVSNVYSLEKTNSNAVTFYGTEAFMLLTLQWRA